MSRTVARSKLSASRVSRRQQDDGEGRWQAAEGAEALVGLLLRGQAARVAWHRQQLEQQGVYLIREVGGALPSPAVQRGPPLPDASPPLPDGRPMDPFGLCAFWVETVRREFTHTHTLHSSGCAGTHTHSSGSGADTHTECAVFAVFTTP